MFFGKKKTAVEFVPVVMPAPSAEPEDAGKPRKKILVVDDDPIIVKTLTMTLHAKGYHVLSALDGAEAIGVVREKKPDMLLVDVCLSGSAAGPGTVLWDGFQVTRWLQIASPTKIPTIIISGTDVPEYQQRAAAIGAAGFMVKPIDNARLLNSINSALALLPPKNEDFVPLKMAQQRAE